MSFPGDLLRCYSVTLYGEAMNTDATFHLCICGHEDEKHTRRDGGCKTCRGGCRGFQHRMEHR